MTVHQIPMRCLRCLHVTRENRSIIGGVICRDVAVCDANRNRLTAEIAGETEVVA